MQHLIQPSTLVVPGLEWNPFSVKQDSALLGGGTTSGNPEGGKPREQLASFGGGVIEHPEQPTSPGGQPVEILLAGLLPLQHHGPSHHQVTPAVTRVGNPARSLKERSANDSAHYVVIGTDSIIFKLRRLGHTERRSSRMLRSRHMKQSRLWSTP